MIRGIPTRATIFKAESGGLQEVRCSLTMTDVVNLRQGIYRKSVALP